MKKWNIIKFLWSTRICKMNIFKIKQVRPTCFLWNVASEIKWKIACSEFEGKINFFFCKEK